MHSPCCRKVEKLKGRKIEKVDRNNSDLEEKEEVLLYFCRSSKPKANFMISPPDKYVEPFYVRSFCPVPVPLT